MSPDNKTGHRYHFILRKQYTPYLNFRTGLHPGSFKLCKFGRRDVLLCAIFISILLKLDHAREVHNMENEKAMNFENTLLPQPLKPLLHENKKVEHTASNRKG